ncbi:MAG: hypothetical protein E6639_26480, partial [Klebsiella pneumoniae]|nr:hypothetical protein [Klebsiella pneumoniae]
MAYVPPVGQTTDPNIFLENVKRADELVNGQAATIPDRGGEPLDTWRQMMAKNAETLKEIQDSITILGLPFTTLAEAQAAADDGKIPVGAVTGTVAKLAMRQPFVLFKGLTFQKLCLPGAFRPG